jgi:hypothetical protein
VSQIEIAHSAPTGAAVAALVESDYGLGSDAGLGVVLAFNRLAPELALDPIVEWLFDEAA